MKIKVLAFTTIALMAASCIVQQPAKGSVEDYDYAVSGEVKALSASGGVDIIVDDALQPGEVRVRTNTDVIENVEVYIEGSTLCIKQTTSRLRPKVLEVRVPAYDYEGLAASGGSDITWRSCNVPVLTVAASGGAEVDIEANSYTITVSTSGGAGIEIWGSCRQLDVAASGGADVSAERLAAKHVTVSASGGADVEVYATESITVLASGGADVSYSGNPRIKDINTSGGADVERDND